jgi:hypothetical protein
MDIEVFSLERCANDDVDTGAPVDNSANHHFIFKPEIEKVRSCTPDYWEALYRKFDTSSFNFLMIDRAICLARNAQKLLTNAINRDGTDAGLHTWIELQGKIEGSAALLKEKYDISSHEYRALLTVLSRECITADVSVVIDDHLTAWETSDPEQLVDITGSDMIDPDEDFYMMISQIHWLEEQIEDEELVMNIDVNRFHGRRVDWSGIRDHDVEDIGSLGLCEAIALITIKAWAGLEPVCRSIENIQPLCAAVSEAVIAVWTDETERETFFANYVVCFLNVF